MTHSPYPIDLDLSIYSPQNSPFEVLTTLAPCLFRVKVSLPDVIAGLTVHVILHNLCSFPYNRSIKILKYNSCTLVFYNCVRLYLLLYHIQVHSYVGLFLSFINILICSPSCRTRSLFLNEVAYIYYYINFNIRSFLNYGKVQNID